jgi:hypothetical protein
MALLLIAVAISSGTTGCATTGTTATASNDERAPDPAWYQSSDNPFRAD